MMILDDLQVDVNVHSKEYAAAMQNFKEIIAMPPFIPSAKLPKKPTFGQAYAAACAKLKIHPTKG